MKGGSSQIIFEPSLLLQLININVYLLVELTDIDHLDVSIIFHSFSHLSYDPTVGILYTMNRVPLNTSTYYIMLMIMLQKP